MCSKTISYPFFRLPWAQAQRVTRWLWLAVCPNSLLHGGNQALITYRSISADLIGAMTWPIDVLDELREAEELNDPNFGKIDYSSLLTAQLHYKAAILRSGAINSLFRIMYPALDKSRR
jgi:hypothetical protein